MWRDLLTDVIGKTLAGFRDELTEFSPRLLAMLVILGLGALAAGTTRAVLRRLLPRFGFDRFAERSGLGDVLGKGGFSGVPSAVVAAAAAGGIFGAFAILALGALNLELARELLSRSFAYLPQLLIAAAILVLGTLVSGFLRRSVLIAAVNAGLPTARPLAGAVHGALMVFFAAMALEHLGVGRLVLLTSFAIVFGGVVLALALAFGLAGRDLARELLLRFAHPLQAQKLDATRHI